MKYSGIFFIPSSSATPDASKTLLTSLIQNLESHDSTTHLQTWHLTHHLLRSAIPPLPQPELPIFQHILHHTTLSSRTFCYVSPAPPTKNRAAERRKALHLPDSSTEPATRASLMSIPETQAKAWLDMQHKNLSALWTYKHALSVFGGQVYAVGQFEVGVGELRITRSVAGQTAPIGIAVCISTPVDGGGEEEGEGKEKGEVDLQAVQELVRVCWKVVVRGLELGKGEVREFWMDGVEKEWKGKEAVVRMWCELLKLRVGL
ncbi:hypothetical protein EJ04DRAFT_551674 [Polyplosphaeria fusca]|uniref:Mediator of RNA polymerase II transcription subunit 20 n=1 Tax=Polyplosphaeria fusca TaxID=682080 RepID=A0A9P4R334_9PLEO|nr:hypothetical protein EJ04DRAFT_551674 [Polyplosphaeria fusca]